MFPTYARLRSIAFSCDALESVATLRRLRGLVGALKAPLVFLLLAPLALVAAPAEESAVKANVARLLGRMTLDEKIGQLVQYAAPGEETGITTQASIEQEVRAGRCGNILNLVGVRKIRALQEIAVRESRLGVPLLFGFDVIHGFRTIFPVPIGQAAAWNPQLVEQAERIAATEASAAGVNWTNSPMLDIARDPRWGRIVEGAGEDPFLASAIAAARVRGFQGDDLSRSDTLLTCLKHFAAYGASQAGRDYNTAEVPEIVLRDVYFPPFQAAIAAGAGSIMASFSDLNGTPATANAFLLTQVLRHEWGFQGPVVSDWRAIEELMHHGVAADETEAARLAINAGVDIDMESRLYSRHLRALVAQGRVKPTRIDQAAGAVLVAKARLGLFEDPYRYCDETRESTRMLQPPSLEVARDLARKSCVLLKNSNGTLPLPCTSRVALIGPLADAHRDLNGPWQARGVEKETQSLRETMSTALGSRLVFAAGCEVEGDDRSGFDAAIEAASNADVVVAAMGETWGMSGEAKSRSKLDLPGVQLELLRALRASGKPIVLVIFCGRPLTLTEALPYADAVLLAWFPGTMGAPALLDLMSGNVSPSGKLPITFPRSVGQIPIYYSQKRTGRPLDRDKPLERFRSRYLDVPNTPEFPFGFGLSYTTFSYSAPRITSVDASQRISITVTNTGQRSGIETVQLYIRDVVASVSPPVRELKGFTQLPLEPGESAEVTFMVHPEQLAFHHADGSFAPEAGVFEVFVGSDSDAPKIGEFALGQEATAKTSRIRSRS